MIAIAVAAVAAVLIGAILLVRVAGARAEARSVEHYEHALGVLGGLTRRSDSGEAGTHVEPAHTHLLSEHPDFRPAASFQQRPGAPAVRRLEAPQPLVTGEHLPVFSDLEPADEELSTALGGRTTGRRLLGTRRSFRLPNHGGARRHFEETPHAVSDAAALEEAGPAEAVVALEAPPAKVPAAPPALQLEAPIGRRGGGVRRVLLPAAAAVLIAGGLAAGAYALARTGGDHPAGAAHRVTRPQALAPRPLPSAAPGRVIVTGAPASVKGGLVVYDVPPGPYTLSFRSSGTCWLGFEPTASASGPWLAMRTLGPGSTMRYPGRGRLVVRIGNPPVVSISLNGVALTPPSDPQPYDLVLSPQRG